MDQDDGTPEAQTSSGGLFSGPEAAWAASRASETPAKRETPRRAPQGTHDQRRSAAARSTAGTSLQARGAPESRPHRIALVLLSLLSSHILSSSKDGFSVPSSNPSNLLILHPLFPPRRPTHHLPDPTTRPRVLRPLRAHTPDQPAPLPPLSASVRHRLFRADIMSNLFSGM